ncbi:hypothetical protein BJY00DRAFT_307147 [Aspergillus carlsbadensis]|nr:hypothetical protein BJY00DRAFT_307147 [Aspergillus carlsbadensis]
MHTVNIDDSMLPLYTGAASATSKPNPSDSSNSSNSNSNALFPPIAICGMATRLPGGIHTPSALWDLLSTKRSGRCRVPASRYNVSSFVGAGKLGHVASEYGYFLDDIDLRDFDTAFWSGMTRKELEAMDPGQRLALEVVYECLQSAGVKGDEVRGKNVGVFVGTFGGDWGDLDSRDPQGYHMYRMTGQGDYMLANRVSYEFGFGGPSVTTRTACSSSLTALHAACQSLIAGDCTSAVVASANLILSPAPCIIMQEQGIISPSGSCRSFDAAADGYARGEAVSAIYVKKLVDAVRDGDPVRSVIRSSCVNSASASASKSVSRSGVEARSITTPGAVAQEALIRRGLELAGVTDLKSVAMVECHGTGTQVGDPIEATAVGNVFGEHGVYIGSVKSNLGHSEGASGLTSLIKMTLALEKRVIPPNISFSTPNPQIPWVRFKLKVPTEPIPWPADRAELVGVNSFGIGGSNAHVLLASAASFNLNQPPPYKETASASASATPHLLLFSAQHPTSVSRTISNHEAYALSNPDSLPSMSYSLALRREILSHRAFCVTDGEDSWTPSRTRRVPPGKAAPTLVFVFTGQGAQWPRMGRDLIKTVPRFKEGIEELDRVLNTLPDPPGWKLLDEILAPKRKSRLAAAEFSQPCTTALQIALIDLLSSYGVRPAAVVGHSSGEIAAAYAAQAITAADAIKIAYYRGKALSTPNLLDSSDETLPAGGMAAVGLGVEQVTPYLKPGVRVGCENSPGSTTLTGDKEVLEEALRTIESETEVIVRWLRVDRAYHSRMLGLILSQTAVPALDRDTDYVCMTADHMHPFAPAYIDLLTTAGIREAHPTTSVDFFSSVTGRLVDETHRLDPAFWAQNLVSPVLFSTAMTSIRGTHPGPKIFLELGPHSTLSAPIRQILNGNHDTAASPVPTDEYIATLTRNNNSHRDLLAALGELWLRNIPMDLPALFTPSQTQTQIQKQTHPPRFLPDLPFYPWHYATEANENEEKLWSETRLSREWRFRAYAHHELLGVRVLESTDENPAWRNVLRLDSVPWVKDHVVAGRVVFPAAGFVGMAGEASRQVSDAHRGSGEGVGFTVRKLRISAALVLPVEAEGDEGVEIITQLVRVDSDSVSGSASGPAGDPTWYSFTIHSYQPKPNGKKGTWLKHVTGQVSATPSAAAPPAVPSPSPLPLPRPLSRRAWYRKMREMGLEYGPRFMGLTDMSAHPIEKRLVATVVNDIPEAGKRRPGDSVYAVHPASLDCLIQAIIPASFNGLTRRFQSLGLPTYIDEISIYPPSNRTMTIEARIDETPGTAISRTITATSNNNLAIRISGLQLSSTAIAASRDPFPYGPHAAVELTWREDLNLVPKIGSLFRAARIENAADERRRAEVYALLDRFGAACVFDTARRIEHIGVSSARPDLVHFKKWVVRAREMMMSGEYPGLEAADIVTLTCTTQDSDTSTDQNGDALIEDLYSSLLKPPTPASAPATAIYRIHQLSLSLLSGETSALDLLSADNTFHAVNELVQSHADYTAFLALLAHRRPNLRILEIGGGTGATTRRVLDALQAVSGSGSGSTSASKTHAERMYYSYTWTDLSPAFVAAARRTFAGVPGMQFAVLDIERDPLSQGQGNMFEAGSFDLVIACNVLHATSSLHTSLSNIRPLLHAQGRLFIQELSPATNARWINYIMGVLPGWWSGENDGRYPEPYIDVDRWDGLLRQVGFGGVSGYAFDGYSCNCIVAGLAGGIEGCIEGEGRRVTLLHSRGARSDAVQGVRRLLSEAGVVVDEYALGSADAPPAGQDVVSVLDLERPFFHDVDESSFENLKRLLSHLHLQATDDTSNTNNRGILWLTGASQIACKDPRYGLVNGVARVIRTEMTIDFATVELEDFDADTMAHVPRILGQFLDRISIDKRGDRADMEWAIVHGKVLLGRYHFIRVDEELERTAHRDEGRDVVKKVQQTSPGRIETLSWSEMPASPSPSQSLGETEVLVQVRAVGLNPTDLLTTGANPLVTNAPSTTPNLGLEATGSILATGSSVHNLAVGDRVMVTSPAGCLMTTLKVDHRLCVRMPDTLAYEEGATMALAYATAIHCLLDIARLQKGMSMLIHCANDAGGVAAVDVARMIGAEIFATTDTEEETQHLMQTFDIPRHRVFSSRATDLHARVMDATDGEGVDVVLSSGSEELLHASWKCTAEFGTLVDVTRSQSQGVLDLQLSQANRTFVRFDIRRLIEKQPQRIESLMARTVDYYRAGLIHPITPAVFPAGSLVDAFRHLQNSEQQKQHLTKTVIAIPEDTTLLRASPSRRHLILRPDRAYLFVGGLGGLGRSVSTWLAEHGARHLIFLSPSAGTVRDDDPLLVELAAIGCKTTRVPGSVTNIADVHTAITAAGIPIAGVLNASMALADTSFTEMTFATWTKAVAPKVRGTWNLHDALISLQPEQKLDFFFLFSSISAAGGQWGQANYNAGNTFLDAFVGYRRGLGLCAAAVNVGVMRDVGYLSQSGNAELLEALRATAQYLNTEGELLDVLELAMLRSIPEQSGGAGCGGGSISQDGLGLHSMTTSGSQNTRYSYTNHSQICMGMRSTLPMDAPGNRTVWRGDPRMLVYRNVEDHRDPSSSASSTGTGSEQVLAQFLREASADLALLKASKTAVVLANAIGRTLAGFSGSGSGSGSTASDPATDDARGTANQEAIDIDASLSSSGIDSLVSMELRNWIRRKIGVEISVLEIVRADCVRELGVVAQRRLVEKYEGCL